MQRDSADNGKAGVPAEGSCACSFSLFEASPSFLSPSTSPSHLAFRTRAERGDQRPNLSPCPNSTTATTQPPLLLLALPFQRPCLFAPPRPASVPLVPGTARSAYRGRKRGERRTPKKCPANARGRSLRHTQTPHTHASFSKQSRGQGHVARRSRGKEITWRAARVCGRGGVRPSEGGRKGAAGGSWKDRSGRGRPRPRLVSFALPGMCGPRVGHGVHYMERAVARGQASLHG